MFILDYKSRLPIYEQLYNYIMNIASVGAYGENEQLPSTRALAAELGINPNTVLKAYQMLEKDGIIVTIPGKGSFITDRSSALAQKKQMVLLSLKEALSEAKKCEIPQSELLSLIETIYKEDKT
jgi:GntR family transcriptional regulator